ncbi:MAG: HEXXH motif-containing putative peptide modification protein [Acidobacteriota bacterium]
MFCSSLDPAVPASRIARRTARRLERVRRELGRPRVRRAVPGGRVCVDEARAALAALPADLRRRALCGPDLRGFLAEAEIWIGALRRAAVRRRSAAAAPPGRWTRDSLFDLVGGTEHLVSLAPGGRIGSRFVARVARLARRRLREAVADLAASTVGLRLCSPTDRVARLTLEFREDAEQGRPADRIDLGCVPTPGGPLAIVVRASGARRARPPRRLRARLQRRTLFLRAPGSAETVIPAAGSGLRDGRRDDGAGGAFGLLTRETIPGTTIVLAPRVDSRPRRLCVGRRVAGLGERLARALRIVQLAWPDGHREILERTRMVVPVSEPGLVSYSLAARPGVCFINVFGKSPVELADDLLHEAAHHRLRDIQEVRRLLRRGPETTEVQAFHSPWRGTRRPLHGLLHGAYTFLFRAELFACILRLARARPRPLAGLLGPRGPAWIRRELRAEIRMLGRALADLDRAARAGLMTAAGRDLLARMRAWHRRLRGGSARR